MILGVGTDIFEVSRMKAVIKKNDRSLLDDIFTDGEIEYCEKMRYKEQHYAARFSAKEAFMKAIGTGWRFGIRFKEIDIYRNELGEPKIKLLGKALEISENLKISNISISLSHTKSIATAIVILETENN